MLSAQNIEKWEGNFWLFSAYSEFIHEHHLISFQSYQFFRDKTWRWHFSGMVPNIFINKTMIPRPLTPILLWLDENLFFVTSTCMSYRRCGSRTDASRRKPGMGYSQAWLFTQNIKKLEGAFWCFFLICDLVKKHHFLPIKYRFSQNRLPVSLWKCENQVRDPKLGLETCLLDQFCDFHFWPSIHVRVPRYDWIWGPSQ